MPANDYKISLNDPKCNKSVVWTQTCLYCNSSVTIHGYSKSGKCRYKCSKCKRTFQSEYKNQACKVSTDLRIKHLLKEGVGTRGTSRLLKISATTVTKRILQIASRIKRPKVESQKIYEFDELRTYIGNKGNIIWIAYALDRNTSQVIDFNIGNRSNAMLKPIVNTLLISNAKRVYTDKLVNYRYLLPENIHITKENGINHIERKNLTLRTHLKRLARKTICYSKSLVILAACVRIYFWG